MEKKRTKEQPTLKAREEYSDHETNAASVVVIPGTKRRLRMRELHPGTLKRLTRLWIERDMSAAAVDSGDSVTKDLFKEPYFAFKEAALLYLNHDIKIRFLYPLLWRWWAFRYTESQMVPIIEAGKKKAPLEAHYVTMAFSTDMRTDWMKMTRKEAEQYQAELLSAMKRRS